VFRAAGRLQYPPHALGERHEGNHSQPHQGAGNQREQQQDLILVLFEIHPRQPSQ
jgi:hypothetical protein